MPPKVIIKASDEEVLVTVHGKVQRQFIFTYPAMLTGADLQNVLTACGIQVNYSYPE